MEKIDFLKKGITDFFPNFFITFSKVQRNIFNEKSHSNRKTNLKVDSVSCATSEQVLTIFGQFDIQLAMMNAYIPLKLYK